VHSWRGYLEAHRLRRAAFISLGTTASDHGHPSAATADLGEREAQALFARIVCGSFSADDAELFRAQMLTEMAAMSVDDGLVMQIHPGSLRNHDRALFAEYGRDKGADIPQRTDYVHALRPLLERFGSHRRLSVILFTLDESTYSRELAPLAGHYPVLKLGPAWWFHDSPEGLRRFRERTTETAGFYNTVGFNDDTRAFLSIPARHDVARRSDCAFLARLVAEHRLTEDEAAETAVDLAYRLPKEAYRL
ncbi:MAG: glucuronate isomerase, partial [Steroidobacteraceae bacterium]